MSVLENLFTDIADAIRDKTGETDAIRPIDFPEKIAGIKENSIELLENVLIQPDFSNGDQSFSAPDEMAVKSAIIQKPETLIPENIAEGVDIAGILGTLVAGSSGGDMVVSSGRVLGNDISTSKKITHNLGVMPDLLLVFADSVVNATYKFVGLVYLSEAFLTKFSDSISIESNYYAIQTAGTGVTVSKNATTCTITKTTITFTQTPYTAAYYSYIAIGGLI